MTRLAEIDDRQPSMPKCDSSRRVKPDTNSVRSSMREALCHRLDHTLFGRGPQAEVPDDSAHHMPLTGALAQNIERSLGVRGSGRHSSRATDR